MATHTYVVSSATATEQVVTVVGTVDTIPSGHLTAVTINFGLADLLNVFNSGGLQAAIKYVGPRMLQAAILLGLPAPAPVANVVLPTGTFTQNGHTYVVTSVTDVGDTSTIVGTVDGTAVTIQASTSLLQLTFISGLQALENLVAPIMLAQARQNGLAGSSITQFPTGTFTL